MLYTDADEALVAAFSYDDRVLLERYVKGRELAVSVLGTEGLPVVEAMEFLLGRMKPTKTNKEFFASMAQ